MLSLERPGEYHGRDSVVETIRSGFNGAKGGLGIGLAAALISQKPVLTYAGSATAMFTAAAGLYTLGDCVSANIRRKEDAYNGMVGGALAGAAAGALKYQRLAWVVGLSFGGAVSMGIVRGLGSRSLDFSADADLAPQQKKEWREATLKPQPKQAESELFARIRKPFPRAMAQSSDPASPLY